MTSKMCLEEYFGLCWQVRLVQRHCLFKKHCVHEWMDLVFGTKMESSFFLQGVQGLTDVGKNVVGITLSRN